MESTNIKNILVLGGTGRTGAYLLSKLSQKGYKTTSITHRDETAIKSLPSYGNNNQWVSHDLYKTDELNNIKLEKLLSSHDAVISSFGSVKGSPGDIMYVSFTNLINLMDKVGPKRFIFVSADGTHKDHTYAFRWVFRPLFLSTVLADYERTENWLSKEYKGKVEWTAIRPFRLLDGEKGKWRISKENEHPTDGKWTWESYTGDVAQLCVEELEKGNFIRQLVSTGI